MSEAERALVTAHLSECPACQLVITRLSAMSRLFAEAPRERLSQIARARLNRRMEAVMDRGMLRLAWTMSGLAASVLVICSVWLMNLKATPAAPPPWVGVTYASDSAQAAREPATPAAEWYLADAGGPSDDAP
jgi:anti-sigma factor RsiW